MLELFGFPTALPGADVRILAAVLFTGAAAYFDFFNKKWVPNALLYGAVAAAVAINIIFFDEGVFAVSIAIGAAVFGFSYAIYRMGHLGGADVYIMAAIAMAVPFLPKPLLAAPQGIPYPFIFSVLIPTGVLFMLYMLFKFVPYVAKRLANGQIRLGAGRLAGAAMLCVALLFFLFVFSSLPVAVPIAYFALLSFLTLSLIFFSVFKDEVKGSMVSMVPIGKLQEEDVLAIERIGKARAEKLRLSSLLDAKAISALKKSGMKSVPVYTGMPFFLPFLFVGLLFALLFGDPMHYLLYSSLQI